MQSKKFPSAKFPTNDTPSNNAPSPRSIVALRLTPIALALAAVSPSPQAQGLGPLSDVRVNAVRLAPLPGAAGPSVEYDLAPRRAATSDTASLLQDVPGVSLYGAGGASSLPSLRGLADDRVRIKLDGMDLTASCPNHMNPALSYLDPSQVGALKVYAGITPVSLGGDSIGGTIVANTRSPEFAGAGEPAVTRGEVGTFFRSNGNARGLNLAASHASETFAIAYRGAWAKADDYDAAADFKTSTVTGNPGRTLPLKTVGSTAYDTRNHALDLAWRDARNLLEAKLGYQDVPYQIYPNQRMDMLGNRQERINLHYVGQRDWGTLDARVYSERVDHVMDFGPDKQLGYGAAPYVVARGMPMVTKGRTHGATLRADLELSERDLARVGAELQQYRLDDRWPPSPADLTGMLTSAQNPVQATFAGMAPDTFLNINGGKRDRVAAFGEWEARWSPQWSSLLGARVERVTTDTGPVQGYNSVANNMMYSTGYLVSATQFNALDRARADTNVDLTALARFTPDTQTTYEIGLARKTRSPNLYERYVWSRSAMALVMNNFVGDGNGYLGNPDLKPEVAYLLSGSAAWQDAAKTREFRVAPFYTRVSDYVDAVAWDRNANVPAPIPAGQFGVLKYTNQSARLFGVDLSGRALLGRNDLGEWSVRGVVNYVNGRNLDTGSGLYNVMPLNARLALQQQSGDWSNTVEVLAVRAKTDISEPRNEIRTPGYGLVHWRGSYAWRNVRVDFGIENLFNRFHRLPLGGAYVGQGMTMSLNGIPAGIAVPGMGRSAYVGVNVKF